MTFLFVVSFIYLKYKPYAIISKVLTSKPTVLQGMANK